jgi:peptidoglycan/xylan/chitin deacetylase (PgdA/CDA1 family)
MARVLYSADYELYLGENLLPELEVLVEPTWALLDACEEAGVPITLFCDVACLWRYREDGDEAFPAAAEEQLREAVRRGHDVQAHLHPHWLHAVRDTGRWRAPLDTFLVGALDDPAPLLARAAGYLNELLRPVDPAYACVAFRAGNYGLQPEHERVFAALRETGYEVDSSVVPGLVLQNEVNQVDFRGWPERSGELHGLYEVPIASARFGPLDAVRRRLRRPPARAPRGRTIQAAVGTRPSLASRLFRLDLLELGADPGRLRRITARYLRRVGTDVDFSFSCHPKAVGQPELEALRAYHEWLRDAYDVEALTFRRLAAR